MEIDFGKIDSKTRYQMMTQSIIPRPVAWILTQNRNQNFNLAPFSFFNGISSDPPLVSVSIGVKRDGSPKDTLKNIESEKICNLFIAGDTDTEHVHKTGAELNYGQSELDLFPHQLEVRSEWKLPLLCDIKIAFECGLFEIITRPQFKQAIVLLQIYKMMISEDVADRGQSLKINPANLNPLCRLGGSDYASIHQIRTVAP